MTKSRVNDEHSFHTHQVGISKSCIRKHRLGKDRGIGNKMYTAKIEISNMFMFHY